MDAHATPLLPVEEESQAAGVHLPGETEDPFAGKVFREENPEPAVRLPAEAEEQPLTEGLAEYATAPAPGSGERLPASARPWWKRRRTLFLGASVIALGTAGASAFFALPYPVPQTASTMHSAAEKGIRRTEPLAPAASLAGVPTQPAEPATREKYQPKPKDQQLQEVLALHNSASEGSRRDEQSANGSQPAPVSPSPGREAHHGDRDAPPPGYVPSEPGVAPASAASPTKAVRGLRAVGSGAAPGVQPSAEATGAASPSPAAAAPVPAAGEPPHDVTAAVMASLGPASKLAESSPPEPRPTERTDPLSPAPESGKHGDPVETAGGLRPAPLTPADQVQVLELVTQMAAMVRDLRAQHAQLRADFGKTAADNTARLTDLERRLALAEARHALSTAQIAGEPLAVAPSASGPAPAGEALPATGSSAVQTGSVTAPVVVTPVTAVAAASDKGAAKRYRVQAASPGLALLAEIDRGGGDGAQLEVLVGDTIPGYGKITSIGQRGTAWVVTTEHGNIQ